MFKEASKKFLYSSGLLGFYHRIRNANTLTVVMFHRVLPPDDPRWNSCDPDYTLATEWLEASLAFFKRHYHVVSLQQVLEARRGKGPLPPRALLITFDDGWADNADHALPALRRAGLPALMFVVSDAVGARQPFFQERLIGAWRRGVVTVRELASALDAAGAGEAGQADESIAALRRAIARLEDLDSGQRESVLAPFSDRLDDGHRHMVDAQDLHRLLQGDVALGLHGKTHTPMQRAADLDAELGGARASLATALGQPHANAASMSFPHGSFDRNIAARAGEAGYELVFTSVPVLNPTAPQLGWLLGRTGFETDTVVDGRGRFRPDLLALYLFRKPTQRLA